MVLARAAVPLGQGHVMTVDAAAGERRLKGDSRRSQALGFTLQTKLARGIISRTQFARGNPGPLFAKIAVGEELAVALGRGEVRAGGRVSRYDGNVDVRSLHTGLSQEFAEVKLDYAFALYAPTETTPRGLLHRLEVVRKDDFGATHLQLGTGNSLHEHDWRPGKVWGSYRNVALKRKQKVARHMAVEVGAGWTSFVRPKERYGAAKFSAGLVLSR
jgi:YaiO family outer membrane protein